MTNKSSGMTLKAIGVVKSVTKQPARRSWEKTISDIVVDSSLTEALDGLDEFSHIIVIYWMHQVARLGQVPTKVRPMGRREVPVVGLFATRSPNRPNPIGIATVRLLKRQDNLLKVEGLDAFDGTPVIDIKPYIPGYDSSTNAKVPSWITKSHEISRALLDIYRRLMTRYGPQH